MQKSKSQYSIRSNYQYVFHNLKQKEGGRVFRICLGNLGTGICLPFLEAAMPGAVTAALIGRGGSEALLFAAGYMLLLQSVRFWQNRLQHLQREVLFSFRVETSMDFYQKCVDMDVQYLESEAGKRKMSRAGDNLFSGNEQGIEAYAQAFWDMLLNLGGLALYSVTIAKRSLILLFLLMLQTGLSGAVYFWAGRREYALEQEGETDWQHFHYLRRESIAPGNGKDIRLYRLDRSFAAAFGRTIERIVTLRDQGRKYVTWAGISEQVLTFGRNLIIYVYLLVQMIHGQMSLPAFLLYMGIVSGFGAWMSGLFDALQRIFQNQVLMDGYRDFMDTGTVKEEGTERIIHPGRIHEIRLEKVCFRYEGKGEDTIHDLDLVIHPGEKLALTGLNGAGKTTLIKLLCGIYRPRLGRILLDGQDSALLSREEYFREFSVVFQDVSAFSFSLEENVSCRQQGRTDTERLKWSLEEAGMLERVQRMPEKERTMLNRDLDEEGVSLSGGELQKLMLARALYKDAPVVILDEPAAALDPLAESAMYEKYDEMIREKTGIFISHRLSSTRFCDRVIFLEKGRILEEGSHKELMEKRGAYAELFALQARYYQKKKEAKEL